MIQTMDMQSVATKDASQLWEEIVRFTLEACMLRHEGREQFARELLSDRLPPLIQAWSASSILPVEERRSRLRQLFDQAQSAVAIGRLQRQLIVEELTRRLGQPGTPPAGCARRGGGSVQLKRRIPFGDIPSMLEALAESEEELRAETVLPARSVLPLVWETLPTTAEPALSL
ncbi:MAG: hypothetical protein ACHQ5A_11205, partial [Opitutales bacterium]